MIGIKAYGIYVPFHRLSRSEIGRFWGGSALPGEKAVASFDEDAVTMAVEACRECLAGRDASAVDRLYCASTTFPYAEKQSAALIAAALWLRRDAGTADLAGSLRSGTTAVVMGRDAVAAGAAATVLVCAADARLAAPNGMKELDFGDGAAALLLGSGDLVATIDHSYSANQEIYDVFRPHDEGFVRSWEDRFVREKGYAEVVAAAVAAALAQFGATPRDFAKAVFAAPNAGCLAAVAKTLGFDPRAQLQDGLYNSVGHTGTAHPLLTLAAALDQSKPGDRLLWVGYGDGCDVLALTVTDGIAPLQQAQRVSRQIAAKSADLSYQKYLRWRELLPTEPANRPRSEPVSAVALWRDVKCGLALTGMRCKRCGTVQYPVQRICIECRAKDEFEDYPFADKTGRVVTFSHDNLAVSPNPPSTIAAVDFVGGGRIMMEIIDRHLEDIGVGMPVEPTFRRFRYVDGITVYWWKCRPVR